MSHAPLSRRNLLIAAGAAGVSLSFMGQAAYSASEGAIGRRKLIVVICRGGMDGLAVSPPVGDPDYAGLRGSIALPPEATLKLDGTFGLHPSFKATHALALKGQARIVPAVASSDRRRSHFEAQDTLETGSDGQHIVGTGWLNRTLQAMAPARAVKAMSVGATAPLILRGPAQAASWSPGGVASRNDERLPSILTDLYAKDPVLGPALARGLETEVMAGQAMRTLAQQDQSDDTEMKGGMAQMQPAAATPAQPNAGLAASRKFGQTIADFMIQPGGPQIVAVSVDGFDTHVGQGTIKGVLSYRFASLDALLDGLHAGLREGWNDTAVVVVTEFGRTARVNGSGGTDHGTGSTALLLGGALKPGGIVGDWPTLKQTALFENRDTRPTTDMRGLFKGLLVDHLGVDRKAVDAVVFPDAAALEPTRSLV